MLDYSSLLTACGSVVPSADYAYSPAYTQYGGTYGSYSYGTSSGLISKRPHIKIMYIHQSFVYIYIYIYVLSQIHRITMKAARIRHLSIRTYARRQLLPEPILWFQQHRQRAVRARNRRHRIYFLCSSTKRSKFKSFNVNHCSKETYMQLYIYIFKTHYYSYSNIYRERYIYHELCKSVFISRVGKSKNRRKENPSKCYFLIEDELKNSTRTILNIISLFALKHRFWQINRSPYIHFPLYY